MTQIATAIELDGDMLLQTTGCYCKFAFIFICHAVTAAHSGEARIIGIANADLGTDTLGNALVVGFARRVVLAWLAAVPAVTVVEHFQLNLPLAGILSQLTYICIVLLIAIILANSTDGPFILLILRTCARTMAHLHCADCRLVRSHSVTLGKWWAHFGAALAGHLALLQLVTLGVVTGFKESPTASSVQTVFQIGGHNVEVVEAGVLLQLAHRGKQLPVGSTHWLALIVAVTVASDGTDALCFSLHIHLAFLVAVTGNTIAPTGITRAVGDD